LVSQVSIEKSNAPMRNLLKSLFAGSNNVRSTSSMKENASMIRSSHTPRRGFGLPSLVAAVAVVCSLAAGQQARAADILTPAGLNTGDTFRFIFVSTSSVSIFNTNFPSIDATLASNASGYTYNGQSISWSAIVSSSGINARDRVGGFNTNVPVYLVTGDKVANDLTTSGNGLWSGSLLRAVNVGIAGNTINNNMATGTTASGTVGSSMGASVPTYGVSSSSGGGWLNSGNSVFGSGGPFRVYGISSDLTVAVPEPSTYALGAIATGVMAAVARRRKARKA
jgi:hypothetical protein